MSGTATVYVITPTYSRPSQQPDLTRMSQALLLAQAPVHWILVEDSTEKSAWIVDLLKLSKLNHTHLTSLSSTDYKCRGIDQRNEALRWINANLKNSDGVMFFGDDDNAYDLRLFHKVGFIDLNLQNS